MQNQDVLEKYEKVKTSLDYALREADKIELSGDEENVELQNIRNALQEYNQCFKDEIEKLEQSSEWDKFCMAFFGETNAGKSTIIEALRIIYEEETRQNIIDKQNKEYQNEKKKVQENYSELVQRLKELNDSLVISDNIPEKKHTVVLQILFGVGFIVIGIIVGFGICLLAF